jgi:hypothetical protein
MIEKEFGESSKGKMLLMKYENKVKKCRVIG